LPRPRNGTTKDTPVTLLHVGWRLEADMTRIIIPALVLLLASSAVAHHSYGDILREQRVSIAGVVEQIDFVNPHVVTRVRGGLVSLVVRS
jgi:hypothetical protein